MTAFIISIVALVIALAGWAVMFIAAVRAVDLLRCTISFLDAEIKHRATLVESAVQRAMDEAHREDQE